jgi:hypothetical protein
VRCLLLTLLLPLVELDQFLLNLTRFLLLVLPFLPLLLLIPAVNFLEMLLVEFCLLCLFLLQLAAVGLVLLPRGLDPFLEGTASGSICFFLPAEESVLVLGLLN